MGLVMYVIQYRVGIIRILQYINWLTHLKVHTKVSLKNETLLMQTINIKFGKDLDKYTSIACMCIRSRVVLVTTIIIQ